MVDWGGGTRLRAVSANPLLPQAMNLRNLSPLALVAGGFLFVACTPYPEDAPPPPPPPPPPADQAANKTLSAEEQKKLQEERRKAAEEAEKRMAEKEKPAGSGGAAEKTGAETGGATGAAGGATGGGGGKPATERKDWPFASPVPGKTGFVFSPYNNKVIDVRDIPSGMLVQDPTYPASEKKYFRVP
jgi:hypothetical protein